MVTIQPLYFHHCVSALAAKERRKMERATLIIRSKPKIHKTSLSSRVLFAMRIYPLANSVLNEGTSVPRCQNKERGREESREQVKLTYNFMGIHSRCSSGLSNSSLATSRVYSAWNPRAREREMEKRNTRSHIDFED